MHKFSRISGIVQLGLILIIGLSGVNGISGIGFVAPPQSNRAVMPNEEAFRIQISNAVSGSIMLSRDRGITWQIIGAVIQPISGRIHHISAGDFTASDWGLVGSITATAVNAIHVKVSQENPHSWLFSILPKESMDGMMVGSYRVDSASIFTDIPGGTAIFGGAESLRCGDPLFLSSDNGNLIPWPDKKAPEIGDILVIISGAPRTTDWQLEFDNEYGGSVWWSENGKVKRIGRVMQPVSGTGRFEGTLYQEIGRVRANHPGVICVSTSPQGEIGGFQIIPSTHANRPALAFVRSTGAYMVVGPLNQDSPYLEGQFPLYMDLIRPGDIVECKIRGEWQQIPSTVGKNLTIFENFLEAIRIRPADRPLQTINPAIFNSPSPGS